MTWLFSGILFIYALVVSFAALALGTRAAANDTTRAQINNIPEKSHVIPLLIPQHVKRTNTAYLTNWYYSMKNVLLNVA